MLVLGFIVAALMGAFLRWGTAGFTHPWGTFFVNILGSFAIGFLFVYLEKSSPQIKTWIFIALLGSFTTYSSFSLDMVKLFDQGAFKLASIYFLSTNVLCLGGCYMGWMIAKNMVTSY